MPERQNGNRNRNAASLSALTLDSLPPVDTSRWVARRKAEVVSAVETGLITVDEACRLYKLTLEEFLGWQRALFRFGVHGLQVTSLQVGRFADERSSKRQAWSRRRPRVVGHA
jgi:Protein of unknown function (DUF1153)